MRDKRYRDMAEAVQEVVNTMGFNPMTATESLVKELNHPYEVHLFRMVCQEFLDKTEDVPVG